MDLVTTCPWCSRQNELTSQVAEPAEQAARPGPGDLSMCMHCGVFSVFDEDMMLRRPTRAEVVDIGMDPKCRAMRMAFKELHPRQ